MIDIAQTILERVLDSRHARSITGRLESDPETGVASTGALVPLLAAFLYRAIGGPLVVAVPAGAPEMSSDIGCFVPGEVFHLPGPGAAGDWFRPYDEAVGRRLEAARALRSGKIAVVGVEAIVGGVPGELPR